MFFTTVMHSLINFPLRFQLGQSATLPLGFCQQFAPDFLRNTLTVSIRVAFGCFGPYCLLCQTLQSTTHFLTAPGHSLLFVPPQYFINVDEFIVLLLIGFMIETFAGWKLGRLYLKLIAILHQDSHKIYYNRAPKIPTWKDIQYQKKIIWPNYRSQQILNVSAG